VSEELDALILRLLARAPDERFEGSAVKAAEALEQAWRSAETREDRPLFGWDTCTAIRLRSPGRVRRAEEHDAAAREEHARREVEERSQAVSGRKLVRPGAWSPLWGAEMAVALVGLLLTMLTVVILHRRQEVARTAAGSGGGDIVAVGDSASGAPILALAPMRTDITPPAVGLPMPEKPFPGQRTPPCNRNGEVELRGGCWYELARATLPCKEDAYEWNGACYLPSYPARRQQTSEQP
jgi:hypothetical protein